MVWTWTLSDIRCRQKRLRGHSRHRAAPLIYMTKIIRNADTGEAGNPGSFGTHHHTEADIALVAPPRNGRKALDTVLALGANVDMKPVGEEETRAVLRNNDGEPDGAIRVVELGYQAVPQSNATQRSLQISGPDDGRPLVILVTADTPNLNVISGNVFVVADSSASTNVTFREDSTGVVDARKGRRVMVNVNDQAHIDFYAGDHGWGSIRVDLKAHMNYFGDPQLHGVNGSSGYGNERGISTKFVTYHE